MVSDNASPANARLPVSISYSTHPNAQMSMRVSTGWPRACSGLMYAAVPNTTPSLVLSTASANSSEDFVVTQARGNRHGKLQRFGGVGLSAFPLAFCEPM